MNSPLLTAFVLALAQVETPNGVPDKPGPAGETGRWQLTPAVRRDRGDELLANRQVVTDEAIARAHVLWLKEQLRRAGVDALPFNIALAWNCGLERTVQGKAPARSFDFATRVCRLASVNLEQEPAKSKRPLFWTVTGRDFGRAIAWARLQPDMWVSKRKRGNA